MGEQPARLFRTDLSLWLCWFCVCSFWGRYLYGGRGYEVIPGEQFGTDVRNGAILDYGCGFSGNVDLMKECTYSIV